MLSSSQNIANPNLSLLFVSPYLALKHSHGTMSSSRQPDEAPEQKKACGFLDKLSKGDRAWLRKLCLFPKEVNGNSEKLKPERYQYIGSYLESLNCCKLTPCRENCYCVRPRILSVLENIGATKYMDEFLNADIKDISLPFSQATLPDFIKDEDIRRSFLQQQACVLTDARKLESSEGHIHFEESANEHVSANLQGL